MNIDELSVPPVQMLTLISILFRVYNNETQSIQLLSCVTLCDPMDCSMPGFPVHHQLLGSLTNIIYFNTLNVIQLYSLFFIASLNIWALNLYHVFFFFFGMKYIFY